MTTQLPTRTRSVVERQRSMVYHPDLIYTDVPPTRPVSWHPSFATECQSPQFIDQHFFQDGYDLSMNTAFAHGLITPNPFPAMNQPYLDCPDVPLDQMIGQDFSFSSDVNTYPSVYPYELDNSFAPYTPLSGPTVETTDYQIQNMPWPPLPASIVTNIATAPASPDFLPMPDMGQSFNDIHSDEPGDKDDLVGMGLYDSPAQVQSASLLFSGSIPVRRKSLKLEESFEPAPQSDAGDEEDAEADPVEEPDSPPSDQRADNSPATDETNEYLRNPLYASQMQQQYVPAYSMHTAMVNGNEPSYGWF